MRNIPENNNEKQQIYKCKCGKEYKKQGSCYNHIKAKHGYQIKEYYIHERQRGRPAKETQQSQNLRKGFVPSPELINLIPNIKLINDNVQYLKQYLQQIQFAYQNQISELSNELDEDKKIWFYHSKQFIEDHFSFIFLICEKEVKQFIIDSYNISLLSNCYNENNILLSFFNNINQVLKLTDKYN